MSRNWKASPIVDISAWTGPWGTFPVRGEVDEVREALRGIGVERICLSPLHAAWCHNPHCGNEAVYAAARGYEDVDPVPVLDPTIPTWRAELARAVEQPRTCLVRLLPAYSQYELGDVGDFLQAVEKAGLGVIVQTRLEDPRRQHPLAQVPDVPAEAVAEMARRFRELTVILGGAPWRAIMDLREVLLELPRFYADVSQADGMDSLKLFVEAGLTPRLLFGTHAPLFVPLAGLARVVTDLEDEPARAILGGNARQLLDGLRRRE